MVKITEKECGALKYGNTILFLDSVIWVNFDYSVLGKKSITFKGKKKGNIYLNKAHWIRVGLQIIISTYGPHRKLKSSLTLSNQFF